MIRLLLDAWRKRRELADFERGYAWAATELLKTLDSDIVIEQIENGSYFDHTAFDVGADAAVDRWRQAYKLNAR